MSQALGPEKKMRLDTCIPWVALFALFVSIVNLGMYILSRRELQAVRIAEKRNEILILYTEAELIWQKLSSDSHVPMRAMIKTGESPSPDFQDVLDNILKVATSLREGHPPIDANTDECEADVARRLAATIDMNASVKQMETHARDVMSHQET